MLAVFPTIQQAAKGRDALQSAEHTDIVLHNLANPTCPKWITDIVVSDPDYCSRRANYLEKRLAQQADARDLTPRSRQPTDLTQRLPCQPLSDIGIPLQAGIQHLHIIQDFPHTSPQRSHPFHKSIG